jgi:hypothetical protein
MGLIDDASSSATKAYESVKTSVSSTIDSVTGQAKKTVETVTSAFTNKMSKNETDTRKIISSDSILGKPPRFLPTTDPHNRVYIDTLIPAPVISITPGRPEILNKLRDDQKLVATKLLAKWHDAEVNGDNAAANNQQLLRDVYKDIQSKSGDDGRMLRFEPDPGLYLKVLHTMLGRVSARMNYTGMDRFLNPIQLEKWGSLMFYMDKSSSFSESGSNELSQSIFSSVANMARSVSNEFQMLADATGWSDAKNKDLAKRHEKLLTGVVNNDDPTGLWSKIGATLAGDQLLIPQMWSTSSFSRSYSINFVFESAYGDRASIMRDVYTPFLALAGLCFPRQTSMNSFASPFMVRVDCPGLWTIDCGMITSFSFKKSTDHLTYDNLTRRIEVSIDVVDLYPSLMSSPDYDSLKSNFGLVQYLDNLAAADYTRINKNANIVERVQGSLSYFGMKTTGLIEEYQAQVAKALQSNNPFRL